MHIYFSFSASTGTALLSVAAFPLEDFYIGTHHLINNVPKKEQTRPFHVALLAVCLGTGGIRAVVCPLGATAFRSVDPRNEHPFLTGK